MTDTLEAPVVVEETTISMVRPTDAARLAEIVVVLARNGVLTVARRGGALVLRPRHQAPRTLAVALRRSFADLGPTYVKFGQLIASSPGLFPEFLATELRRLLDSVPPEPVAKVRRVIERDLGQPIEVLFADFDDTPLAAASIAQVHRARLHDGTDVAVKVRRPHLRGRIEQDLRLLRLLAGVLARAGALGETLNPTAVVDDLALTLRAELDFEREAASMVSFAANLAAFGANHDCVVPRPIDGMVTERVLVMTYIDGTPVDDGTALRAAGHDLEGLVRTGVRAWLEGALEHGLFHGDVHAGNLFVTPAGDIAFFDFGIMGRLDDRTRLVLAPGPAGGAHRRRLPHRRASRVRPWGGHHPGRPGAGRCRCPRAARAAGHQAARRDQLRRAARPHPARRHRLPRRAPTRAGARRQAAPVLRALRQRARPRLQDPRRPQHPRPRHRPSRRDHRTTDPSHPPRHPRPRRTRRRTGRDPRGRGAVQLGLRRRPDRADQAVRQGQALAVERHHRHRLVRSTSTRSTPAASRRTCR